MVPSPVSPQFPPLQVATVISLLRLPDVLARTGLSRSTIYSLIPKGEFPPSVPLLGSRTVAWTSTSIDEWISERLNQTQTKNQKQLDDLRELQEGREKFQAEVEAGVRPKPVRKTKKERTAKKSIKVMNKDYLNSKSWAQIKNYVKRKKIINSSILNEWIELTNIKNKKT